MPSTNLRVMRSSSRRLSLARIDGDAPLGAAVGNVDDGRLPGHQRGQRADLVQVDLGMVAQAPLHRPAGVVVLHAIADERGDLAVVQLDGDLHRHLALGGQQNCRMFSLRSIWSAARSKYSRVASIARMRIP